MESLRGEKLEVIEKPDIEQERTMQKINAAMINHAREIAQEVGATAVLVYLDVIKSRENMESLLKGSRCILAAKDPDVINDLATIEGCKGCIVRVPYMHLTRLSQIKVAAILALSKACRIGSWICMPIE